MSVNGEWFKLNNPPKRHKGKAIPLWMWRTFQTEEGQLFVPITLVGDPMTVFLAASFDGAAIIRDDEEADAVYVDAEWAVREFPDTRHTVANIRRKIAKCEG